MSRVEMVPTTRTGVARRGRAGAVLRFCALGLIWGMSFLLIKVGTETLAPLQVTFGRMVAGTVTLLVVLVARRDRLPRGVAVWAHLAVAALILNVVPFALFAYAEQRVSSVLAGVCNATTPLFTVAVALAVLPAERPTRRRVTGLAVGFLGTLVVLGVWQGVAAGNLAGAGMAFGAACCYGAGWAYLRRFLAGTPGSAVALSAAQLLVGTVELAVLTPLLTGARHHVSARSVLAVAALGVFGTGLAYVLQYGLIRQAGATVASTVTYCIPVVATVAGVAVLHEQLTWNVPIGAAVVIAGAALSANRRTRASVSRGPGRGGAWRRDRWRARCTARARSGPARR